jgi:hypothetical protein
VTPHARQPYRRRGYSASRFSLVLDEHPTLLASEEVEREVGADDGTERALRDLTGAGLLRQEGATVFPTRAALHFDRLAA